MGAGEGGLGLGDGVATLRLGCGMIVEIIAVFTAGVDPDVVAEFVGESTRGSATTDRRVGSTFVGSARGSVDVSEISDIDTMVVSRLPGMAPTRCANSGAHK